MAAKELGYAAAKELADRLADIEAVDTVDELSVLFGDLMGDRSATERFLTLSVGLRVVFVSGHSFPATARPKVTDWKKTSRMKIIAIESIDG